MCFRSFTGGRRQATALPTLPLANGRKCSAIGSLLTNQPMGTSLRNDVRALWEALPFASVSWLTSTNATWEVQNLAWARGPIVRHVLIASTQPGWPQIRHCHWADQEAAQKDPFSNFMTKAGHRLRISRSMTNPASFMAFTSKIWRLPCDTYMFLDAILETNKFTWKRMVMQWSHSLQSKPNGKRTVHLPLGLNDIQQMGFSCAGKWATIPSLSESSLTSTCRMRRVEGESPSCILLFQIHSPRTWRTWLIYL